MTREQVLERLRNERAVFDAKVAAVPRQTLEAATPGGTHSVKEIVAHVVAYEELIVERLRAARRGETTSFDRDREGWEAFNERVWGEAAGLDIDDVLARSAETFAALLAQIGQLSDEELNDAVGVTEAIDQGWLEGRPLWELIGIDAFEHYPMHYDALDAAVAAAD